MGKGVRDSGYILVVNGERVRDSWQISAVNGQEYGIAGKY
jgi:hypothetical protein